MDLTAEEISIIRRARRAIGRRRLYRAAYLLVALVVVALAFQPDVELLILLTFIVLASDALHQNGFGAPTYEQLVELLESHLPEPAPIIAALENRDPTRTP